MKTSGLLRVLNGLVQSIADGRRVDLLCSASYERRCLSVPLALRPKHVSSVKCVYNVARSELNDHARHQLGTHFGADRVEEIAIDSATPLTTASALDETIRDLTSHARALLVVDITTFTHESICMLVQSIHGHAAWGKVLLVYCPAAEYSTDTSDPARKWLSRGVGEARTIVGFPGESSAISQRALVVLCGLETHRATEIIRQLEPTVCVFGTSIRGTAYPERLQQVVADRIRGISQSLYDSDVFEFDPFDEDSVTRSVLAKSKHLVHYNLSICPLSTKISTLGIAIAAIAEPRMSLIYAPAELYNFRHYSVASKRFIAWQRAG